MPVLEIDWGRVSKSLTERSEKFADEILKPPRSRGQIYFTATLITAALAAAITDGALSAAERDQD